MRARIFGFSTSVKSVFAVSLLLLSLTTGAAGALDQSTSNDSFCQVVLDNFDSWDLNHNGHLDLKDIDHALLDPRNRGVAACALSVLHVNHKKATALQKDGYTRAWFERMAANPKQSASYQKSFEKAETKLSQAEPVLFTAGAPNIQSMHQGKTGDCYFIATLGSLVTSNPELVRQMIRSNRDGTYTVFFQGHEPITVTRPSDGELATFGQATHEGIWLNVLERAWAEIRMERKQDDDEDEMYQGICGGRSGTIIKLLTGDSAQRISFKKVTTGERVRKALAKALADGRIVTTSISSYGADGKRKGGHVLAVVGFDKGSDVVTIWNPWGSDIVYKAVGIKMDHGFFRMPVSAWLHRFGGVVIQD